ncbi:hypothetical protein PV327_008724 [Microctonus hyperodae]|uniref:Uncharacterized protein n=1 Tax=Microctonus hyperodae TaxID=165561 RepID=A0AA39F3R5_MICHY|nr:hypothetical protein PV327_008724 [Microctonus hyperodae]
MRLWIPLGAGSRHDQPDKSAEEFLARSMERSDSLPLQTWHSLARSTLSWFISRTSINGIFFHSNYFINQEYSNKSIIIINKIMINHQQQQKQQQQGVTQPTDIVPLPPQLVERIQKERQKDHLIREEGLVREVDF